MLIKWVYLLFLCHHTLTFNFFNCCNKKIEHFNLTEDKPIEKDDCSMEVINIDELEHVSECQNHINNEYCGDFKYTFNPYKDIVRRKQVLPVCIRCALCLSISEQVRRLFDDVIRESSRIEPAVTKQKLDEQLNGEFCTRTFNSHDLRSCGNETIIVKFTDCGTHIRTEFDGRWPIMMKDMCSLFISQLDANSKFSFFNQYRQQLISIDAFLCRGDGVFRECKNLINETHSYNTPMFKRSFWKKCFF